MTVFDDRFPIQSTGSPQYPLRLVPVGIEGRLKMMFVEDLKKVAYFGTKKLISLSNSSVCMYIVLCDIHYFWVEI